MDSSKERDPSYVYVDDAWVTIKACNTESLKRIYHNHSGASRIFIKQELAKRGWTPPRPTAISVEWTYLEPK